MKSLNPFSTGRTTRKTAKPLRGASAGVAMFEALESRTMQSVSPSTVVHADIIRARVPQAGLAAASAISVPVVSKAATASVVTQMVVITKPPVVVLDAIQTKYQALGGASSFLGQLVGSETATGVNGGTFQNYQGGTIYWSAATGAHEVHGMILQKFLQLGGVAVMGYPTTDQTSTVNSLGWYNNFSNGGAVYYENNAGQAYGVSGPTYQAWLANGGILGRASLFGTPVGPVQGFPTSDVQIYSNGQICYFENVKMIYSPQTGITSVPISSVLTYNSPYLYTSQAAGGSASLTLHQDGSYSFSWTMNNTSLWGWTHYSYDISVTLVSPTGQVYTFAHSGLDGANGDSGTINGTDTRLAANWRDLQGFTALANADASISWATFLTELQQSLTDAKTVVAYDASAILILG